MVATKDLEALLRPQEKLFGDPEPLNDNDDSGESFFVRVRNADQATNRTALLVMPNKGDFVPPVRIKGEIRLDVRALRGMGRVVIQRAHSPINDNVLLRSYGDIGRGTHLYQGNIYGYYSEGEEPLVVRDDCNKPFLPEYESDAGDTNVARFIREAAQRIRRTES
jgi:hypothetical protein